MTPEQAIEEAHAIIGDAPADDFSFVPSKHPKLLADKAPDLVRILNRSEASSLARRYEEKDADANAAQKAFKTKARRANVAVLLTTCGGVLLAAAVPLAPTILAKPLTIGLGVFGIICGALASMWLFAIREGGLLERWMEARAAGEATRLEYFRVVTGTQAENKGEIPLPLLQLQYFRRYQFGLQQTYYRRRGGQHEASARKVVGISAFAALVASAASGLGGFLGVAINTQWASLAGLATIAAALSAFAAAQEALAQNRKNAQRYSRTRDALEGIGARLSEVEAAAAAGAHQPVTAFVAAVEEQLSMEHREWLGAAERTKASLTKLEETLQACQAAIKTPLDPKPPSPT
jgi:hypothetical protein